MSHTTNIMMQEILPNVETTKDKIIVMAWKLFYKKGYFNTTIDEIVRECGISKGAFYHYFTSKDDLLKEMSNLFDRQYDIALQRVDTNTDSFDKLIYFTNHLFSYIQDNVSLEILANIYSTQIVKKGERFLLDKEREYFNVLIAIITEGQANKQITTEYSVDELVELYAMQERSVLCDWCICEGRYSLKTRGVDLVRIFLEGIFKQGLER